MKKTNNCHVEGILYNHSLEMKTSKKGVNYLRGEIKVATDEEKTNIVSVFFNYVAPTFGENKPNPSFDVLKNILDGVTPCYMSNAANAATVKIDGSLGINEWYSDKGGSCEKISSKRNEGSFIHVNQQLNPKEDKHATFDVDMVITNIRDIEATDVYPEKVKVGGYIFNYRGMAMPYEFDVLDKAAMNYFLGLDVSSNSPVFTLLKGKFVNSVVKKEKVFEGAFSTSVVESNEPTTTLKVIDWAAKDPYIWNDESTMTDEEFKKALSEYELYDADNKQRFDEKKAEPVNTFATSSPMGGFNF